MVNWILFVLFLDLLRNIFKYFWFWLGGAALQTPRILAGGASPTQTLQWTTHPSHNFALLIFFPAHIYIYIYVLVGREGLALLFLVQEGMETHGIPELSWRVGRSWPYYFL